MATLFRFRAFNKDEAFTLTTSSMNFSFSAVPRITLKHQCRLGWEQ
jgi:hypothetical protein